MIPELIFPVNREDVFSRFEDGILRARQHLEVGIHPCGAAGWDVVEIEFKFFIYKGAE
jgi:hypothetical protein